jgi:hypothetical protein
MLKRYDLCSEDRIQKSRSLMRWQKVPQVVTPAKAGVQKTLERLDSRLRGNDRKRRFSTFYELIKLNTEDIDFPCRSPALSAL